MRNSLVAFLLTLTAVILLVEAHTTFARSDFGDADCSGIVNSIDAELVLQWVADLQPSLVWQGHPSGYGCSLKAEIDEDAMVASSDAELILQYEAGLIDHLPPRRILVGTVVLIEAVEGSCLALQTDFGLFLLDQVGPPDISEGQHVRIIGYVAPPTFFNTICRGSVFFVESFEKLI